MRRIETSVVIERPVNEVFAYVIEPSNMPDWAPDYLEGEWTSEGPIREGSTSRRVSSFGGRASESHHVVTAFEENSFIAINTKTGPFEIRESFEFKPVDRGVHVTIAEEVSAPLLLKPAEWIFALTAGRNISVYGDALKVKLEETE